MKKHEKAWESTKKHNKVKCRFSWCHLTCLTPNHHLQQPPSQLARPCSPFQALPHKHHPSLSSVLTLSLTHLSSSSHPHLSSQAAVHEHRLTFRFAIRPLNSLRVLRNTRKFVWKSTMPSTSTPSHFTASWPTEPQIAHKYMWQHECDAGTLFCYFSLPFMMKGCSNAAPHNNNLSPCDSDNTAGASALTTKCIHHPCRRSMQPHSSHTVTVHTSWCHLVIFK